MYANLKLGTLAQLLHVVNFVKNTKGEGAPLNREAYQNRYGLQFDWLLDSSFSCEWKILIFCNWCQIKSLYLGKELMLVILSLESFFYLKFWSGSKYQNAQSCALPNCSFWPKLLVHYQVERGLRKWINRTGTWTARQNIFKHIIKNSKTFVI